MSMTTMKERALTRPGINLNKLIPHLAEMTGAYARTVNRVRSSAPEFD
jgi:hypothetical protein